MAEPVLHTKEELLCFRKGHYLLKKAQFLYITIGVPINLTQKDLNLSLGLGCSIPQQIFTHLCELPQHYRNSESPPPLN